MALETANKELCNGYDLVNCAIKFSNFYIIGFLLLHKVFMLHPLIAKTTFYFLATDITLMADILGCWVLSLLTSSAAHILGGSADNVSVALAIRWGFCMPFLFPRSIRQCILPGEGSACPSCCHDRPTTMRPCIPFLTYLYHSMVIKWTARTRFRLVWYSLAFFLTATTTSTANPFNTESSFISQLWLWQYAWNNIQRTTTTHLHMFLLRKRNMLNKLVVV